MCLVVLAAAVVPVAAYADGDRPEVKVPSVAFSGVQATTARLSAIVAPGDAAASVHFEVGRTTSYGFSTRELPLYFNIPVQVWTTVHGMAPATTYHFRAVAISSHGTTLGPDRTLTTLPGTGNEPAEELSDQDPTPPGDPLTPTMSGAPGTAGGLSGPSDGQLAAPNGETDDSRPNGSVPVMLPERSKSFVTRPVSGTIRVQRPGSTEFTSVSGVAALPVGSTVDAREGTIELSSDTGRGIDNGRFWGAVFQVSQPPSATGTTELSLQGGRPSRCDRSRRSAHAAGSKVPGLWGKDHGGHFRTRGRNSVAAVRGTVWYVAERCAGTLTRVLKGAVEVRDLHTHRAVIVRAGHHLMVRDRARPSALR